MFPDSSEGERKFLVRTDFGSGGGDSRQSRRRGSGRNQQGAGDDSGAPSSSSRGDKRKLFLLVELTCVVQTAKDGTEDSYGDGVAGGGRRGGDGVRGPLKNFRAGSSSGGGGRKRRGRRRVGGIREKRGGDDGDSDSYDSGQGSGSADDRSSGSQVGSPLWRESDLSPKHTCGRSVIFHPHREIVFLPVGCACAHVGKSWVNNAEQSCSRPREPFRWAALMPCPPPIPLPFFPQPTIGHKKIAPGCIDY